MIFLLPRGAELARSKLVLVMDTPSEAPAPARPAAEAKGGDAPGPLLNTLSVEATARLLAEYFHVEEDVVRRGFRNVDGATLSFYTDEELSQAGVTNAPLRRRMLL